jgi:hypothetical protein
MEDCAANDANLRSLRSADQEQQYRAHLEGIKAALVSLDKVEREYWLKPKEKQGAYGDHPYKDRNISVIDSHVLSPYNGAYRWQSLADAAWVLLETVKSEMEGYAGERCEVGQESDKAEEHRARLECIEAAIASLDKGEIDRQSRGVRVKSLQRVPASVATPATPGHEFMTPSEVQAWGIKLRLLWVVNRPPGSQWVSNRPLASQSSEREDEFYWYDTGAFGFDTEITDKILFSFNESVGNLDNRYALKLYETDHGFTTHMGSLECSLTDPVVRISVEQVAREFRSQSRDSARKRRARQRLAQLERVKQVEQLTSEWMPLFRRNCWLSGVPIECSADERMEWARYGRDLGLSEEEIEKLLTR